MIAIMSSETEFLLEGLRGRERAFATGESVFYVGDAVRLVHVVRRGVVHLVRPQDNGTALILQRAGAGIDSGRGFSVFGAVSLRCASRNSRRNLVRRA